LNFRGRRKEGIKCSGFTEREGTVLTFSSLEKGTGTSISLDDEKKKKGTDRNRGHLTIPWCFRARE